MMKTKKATRSLSANGQNEDTATKVRKRIQRDSSGTLHTLATPQKRALNGTPSPTRKYAPRAHSAGPFKDCSSVRTSSRASVSSVAPLSNLVKVRTGKIAPDTMAVISLARLKCSRRTFEGGPISEERFREMQAESYRLKRDLAEKEELQKALVVRLNRAEGSVKRKLRDSVDNISLLPKEKLSALAVLTQNFNTEKKVEELEESLRVSLRDNRRYIQHFRRCKVETEWYKRRLDATVRASRRATSCNCQLSSKRYEKMVKDLRKQLSSLRKKDCMSGCATSQSAVLADDSTLSTQERNCPAGFSTPRERSGPHAILGAVSDPVHNDHSRHGDHLEETEMRDSKVQRPSETVHPVSPTAMQSSLEETLPEQSLRHTLSTLDSTTQLMPTWERLKIVTLKYSKAIEELRLLKGSHESCQQKLQDTHRKLSQERTNCLKLEAAERRLSAELMAAKHLEPLLQQVRQQNEQLEIENAELVASALNVPRTSFSELTILRQQLVEELKQRNIAEAKASNVSGQLEGCKQDLARLAVVEANCEFLKAELVVAKAALRKADKKIMELHDQNKRCRKEINMKDAGLQMNSNTSVSPLRGASPEEETKTHLHKEGTEEPESESEFSTGAEDENVSTQDDNLEKVEESKNIAVKLNSFPPQLNPSHHRDKTAT